MWYTFDSSIVDLTGSLLGVFRVLRAKQAESFWHPPVIFWNTPAGSKKFKQGHCNQVSTTHYKYEYEVEICSYNNISVIYVIIYYYLSTYFCIFTRCKLRCFNVIPYKYISNKLSFTNFESIYYLCRICIWSRV